MRSFYDLMGVPPTGFDPDHRFETSWLLSPILLASLRGLFSAYCFATIFADWGWDGTHHDAIEIGQDFSFFTNLTFFGIAFYMLVASFHTFVYALRGSPPLQRWPRPLQALHSLFYTTIITFPFLVTIVYWGILYSPPWFTVRFDAYSNISRHGLNSVFAILEILLPTTLPPPWLHLPFLIVILLLYLALAYLTHYTEGFYTYDFLDPATGRGKVAAYCAGILAAIIVVLLIVWVLVWLRHRVTGIGKKSRRDFGRARRADAEMTIVGK